jgi:hypothetical protein
MPATPDRNHHRGRRHASTREADDSVPILEPDTGLLEEHQATIQDTNDFGATTKIRNDYRSRNRKFINFIFGKYPSLYDYATVLLSDDDRADRGKYYTPKDTRDLKYTGLSADVFTAFLSEEKTKKNGKLSSYSDLVKYYCAIKWGSITSDRLLPSLFFSKVDAFMKREIIDIKTCCYEIKDAICELSNTIKDTINSADEKGINAAILEQTINAMETRIMTRLDQLNPAGGV